MRGVFLPALDSPVARAQSFLVSEPSGPDRISQPALQGPASCTCVGWHGVFFGPPWGHSAFHSQPTPSQPVARSKQERRFYSGLAQNLTASQFAPLPTQAVASRRGRKA